MNILITGITGRIGANVARHFLDRGHAVRGFVWPQDRQSAKLRQLGAEIFEGDLARSADVNAAADGQEVILHLGAAFQAGGPFTPEQYFDTNVKGTFNVLQAASGLGGSLRHVIVSSTDATMHKYPEDGIEEPIGIDTLPLDTTGWYGYSKILTEHLVDRYVRDEGMPATVFRYGFAFGAGEMVTFPQFHLRTFIDQLEASSDPDAREVLAHARRLRRRAPPDRRPRPRRTAVEEAHGGGAGHRARLRARHRQCEHLRQVYQLASGRPITWDTVVPYLAERLGAPCSTFDLPVTPTHYEHDLSAARRDFGYDPPFSYRQMVDDAVRFARGGASDIIATKL